MNIAIIGSGPAGCYLADHLLRLIPGASIDILEKLPVPFGLIRYGVAPDHQSTKNVARVFDRVLSRDRVSFFGNVEVGRDVKLDELLSFYDAVVLATGAARDRRLGIPGEDLARCHRVGSICRLVQRTSSRATAKRKRCARSGGHRQRQCCAGCRARFSPKAAKSCRAPICRTKCWSGCTRNLSRTIHIVGRRERCRCQVQRSRTGRDRNFAACPAHREPVGHHRRWRRGEGPSRIRRSSAARDSGHDSLPLQSRRRTAFVGDDTLRAVQFRSTSGETVEIPAQLAVTCIGYESLPCCSATPENGVFANDNGKIDDRLYVVGWAKRGPSGTIPTNRVEAQQVAQKIAQEIQSASRPGTPALRHLLEERGCRVVDYDGWKRIDATELSRARCTALPRKAV